MGLCLLWDSIHQPCDSHSVHLHLDLFRYSLIVFVIFIYMFKKTENSFSMTLFLPKFKKKVSKVLVIVQCLCNSVGKNTVCSTTNEFKEYLVFVSYLSLTCVCETHGRDDATYKNDVIASTANSVHSANVPQDGSKSQSTCHLGFLCEAFKEWQMFTMETQECQT